MVAKRLQKVDKWIALASLNISTVCLCLSLNISWDLITNTFVSVCLSVIFWYDLITNTFVAGWKWSVSVPFQASVGSNEGKSR